ncbi:MAG: fumarate hydratase [Hyphomicrobiaceae bacterium]
MIDRAARIVEIKGEDIIETVRAALQYVAVYHAPDYLAQLVEAYRREQSAPARMAIGHILESSRLAAIGKRPICQDTGVVNVFAKVGQSVVIDSDQPLPELIDRATRLAYLDAGNPLRASVVEDPIFERRNTRDNTPAVTHVEFVIGNTLELLVAAKGFGSENKTRFAMLNPADSVEDWVVDTVAGLGAGWCPPGVIGVGVGGTSEKAMIMAKRASIDDIDISELVARGPQTREEELRLRLYDRINALGIGAQGLGGMTTVVDVKVASYPTHAASKPIALVPQCAANRHMRVKLDGTGPAYLAPPDIDSWPQIDGSSPGASLKRVDLSSLTREQMVGWRPGETLLLSGKILTARDAAHRRMADIVESGGELPVSIEGRVIYYVGPVDPIEGEAVGPAGPTTGSRMDPFTEMTLQQGALSMIGKAERGSEAIDAIRRHQTTYLVATGGAAVLVAKAIRSSRLLAFEDLGMEAIREFEVENMPVMVAVSTDGVSIHSLGPAAWRGRNTAVGSGLEKN